MTIKTTGTITITEDKVPKFVDVCVRCYRPIVVIETTGFQAKQSRCQHGTEFVVRYWPENPDA